MIQQVTGGSAAPQTMQQTSENTTTVCDGETLAQVAQRNGVSENDLKNANPNIDPARIQAGQELTLPEKLPAEQPKQVETQFLKGPQRPPSDSKSQIQEHALGGNIRAQLLHRQIESAGQELILTGPNDAKKKSNAQPAESMQSIMKKSGMKDVHNPPSDAELKTYYTKNAPAHDLIEKGDYKSAADEYRKLSGASTNPAEKKRLDTLASQLDIAQTMNDAKVQGMSFPPSETNVQDYFKTMQGKPLSDIQKAYQDYAGAFYVHSEDTGVGKGDIVYGNFKKTDAAGKAYTSHSPEKWEDISDKRQMHTDGRRIVDCEGYALMGQKCLQSAGFDHLEFAVMSRYDDPKTKEDESLSKGHIMITGQRSVKSGDLKGVEVAVISNNKVYSGSDLTNIKQAVTNEVTTKAYIDTFRGVVARGDTTPGGTIMYGPDAGQAVHDYFKMVKSNSKPAVK